MASPDPEYFPSVDRTAFTARNLVEEIWTGLDLPAETLNSLHLLGDDGEPALSSSYKIGTLAQSSIGLTALLAAQIHAHRNRLPTTPAVTVAIDHAVLEFKSEQLYTLDGRPPGDLWGPLGGLHATGDGGHVRVHDGFPHHRAGALLLTSKGTLSPGSATREHLSGAARTWPSALDLESAAHAAAGMGATHTHHHDPERKQQPVAVLYALRSYAEWDAHPQSHAVNNFPIDLGRGPTSSSSCCPSCPSSPLSSSATNPLSLPPSKKPLSGLRVLDLSRVIAAPLASRILALHGADVLWVTSPNLPDLPNIDRDTARGKRTVQLDFDDEQDKEKFLELLDEADVVVQGYRPGSLERKLGLEKDWMGGKGGGRRRRRRRKGQKGLIVGNLSAFGPRGDWKSRRGFDSLVQTCSGMNVSEGEHYFAACLEEGEGGGGGDEGRREGEREMKAKARPLPCQALDHAAGYMLAAGVMAAFYKREVEEAKGEGKGGWVVDVSLAGQMRLLRSLGQYPGGKGFRNGKKKNAKSSGEVPDELLETRSTGFGEMRFVKHAATIEGCEVGWDLMPRPLGSDKAEWL